VHESFLEILRCPGCHGRLECFASEEIDGRVLAGALACASCRAKYPIVAGVPRFVPSENYAGNFGLQWNRYRKTQLDSYTGLPLSRDRFLFSTGWTGADLKGRRVLDVGCGAGRFSEVALALGADVTALDYSSAVEAAAANLGPHPRFNVVQADIYAPPFAPEAFDFVYCLGVLQHTPDVRRAFLSIPPLVKRGGRVAVDVYPWFLRNVLWSKYWIRPITKRIPPDRLFPAVERMVAVLLPVSRVIARTPVVGRKLRFAIPVANHEPDFPLTPAQVHEWAVLNTYDMLAPAHDHPQRARTLRKWFEEAGLKDVRVFRKGHLIGQGRRSVEPDG
jgi:SAM-dependent methyltransferase